MLKNLTIVFGLVAALSACAPYANPGYGYSEPEQTLGTDETRKDTQQRLASRALVERLVASTMLCEP
jgi:hypothetical protein